MCYYKCFICDVSQHRRNAQLYYFAGDTDTFAHASIGRWSPIFYDRGIGFQRLSLVSFITFYAFCAHAYRSQMGGEENALNYFAALVSNYLIASLDANSYFQAVADLREINVERCAPRHISSLLWTPFLSLPRKSEIRSTSFSRKRPLIIWNALLWKWHKLGLVKKRRLSSGSVSP